MSFSQTIEIIDVSPAQEVKGTKSTYKTTEVAFKDETGKVDGKKLLSFKSENIFAQVLRLQRGDKVTVTREKDAQGYWQWTKVSTDTGASSEPDAVSKPAVTDSKPAINSGRVTGSNYETAEERKVKQRYIVRQSSITAALTYFTNLSKAGKGVGVGDVLSVAREFEDYVFSTDPIQGVVDITDDIPV